MAYNGDPRGASWRRWDLHVHTPASYEHSYGDRQKDDTWTEFLKAIRELPPEMSVLGVNDYFTIEGYLRLRAEWTAGNLPNIQLLLPVIELRLDQLAGHKEAQRVNFHLVFSDEVDPDDIQRSFLDRLTVTLGDFHGPVGDPKRMGEYGKAVRLTHPSGKQPSGSDQLVGFRHAFIDYRDVENALQRSVFRGKVLSALGYTEWAAMRWEGGGGSVKKQVASYADFFFGCSSSPEDHKRHRDKLQDEGVNYRLIDASDAHRLPDDQAVDRRLGQSLTWIKSDPTFEGLRRALQRYDERVYVGEIPPQLQRLRTERTRIIQKVEIRRKPDSSLAEKWFDCRLDLNPGLVAIIGNQGSGKSALTDCVALAGNADAQHFSFLNEKRFKRTGANKASHFDVTLTWEDAHRHSKNLSDGRSPDIPERLRYIPQQFFDVATDETEAREGGLLYREIERAVFDHVPPARRQESASFQALVAIRTQVIEQRLTALRGKLTELIDEIVRLEKETSTGARVLLRGRIAERERAISDAVANPPVPVDPPPGGEVSEEIDALRELVTELSAHVDAAQQAETLEFSNKQRLGTARASLQRIKSEAEELRDSAVAQVKTLLPGIAPSSLLSVTIDVGPIDAATETINLRIREARLLQDETNEGSPAHRLQAARDQLREKTAALGAAQQAYEKYRTEQRDWEERVKNLRGDPTDPEALETLQNALNRIESDVPVRLAALRQERDDVCRDIHASLIDTIDVYRDLAQYVQQYLDAEELTRERYRLEFDLSLTPLSLVDDFVKLLKFQGELSGAEATRQWLQAQIAACDFTKASDVLELSRRLESKVVGGAVPDERRSDAVSSLLRTGKDCASLYSLLYGLTFLKPRYRLTLRGIPLEQLSPGERGILLLIFYLIVDQSDLPLVIDQPEGNLNNQSIYQHLVPVIRKAKDRRQIIMVSHNPNIVVGCDADQIVHAHLDQADGHRVTYTSGAIENPMFKEFTIDKLEGTRPAFDERAEAYIP